MKIKSFFTKWFYIAIILILVGVVFSGVKVDGNTSQYVVGLIASLFQNIGVAIFVANIFTFILGTKEFMDDIRKKLIDIVLSKDFVTALSKDEQKKLLHMVLKPTKELSAIYSGIAHYFNQYVDDSMRLFEKTYRGHMNIDAMASFNTQKNCIQVQFDMSYVIYKVSDGFEPIELGLEKKEHAHIRTIIRGSGGLVKELLDSDATEINNDDPTMTKKCQLLIPDEFNSLSQISVTRKIIEYGEDHWQVFSYKTIKACDSMTISLRCDDGIVVKNCSIYGVQSSYAIEKEDDDSRCRVSTGWMSYNYLKSQYLLEGCKSEILEFLQPD